VSGLEAALAGVVRLLDAAGTPYMLVGGLANAVWGEPRATIDVDVTVWVEEPGIETFVRWVGRELRLLPDAPLDFVLETRVLPAESPDGVRIDLIFGLLRFEREAIERSVTVEMAGTTVRVVTAEDLVLMKAISDRERDQGDAAAIVRRRRQLLDLSYLRPRIVELSKLLERPDILSRFEGWLGDPVG